MAGASESLKVPDRSLTRVQGPKCSPKRINLKVSKIITNVRKP